MSAFNLYRTLSPTPDFSAKVCPHGTVRHGNCFHLSPMLLHAFVVPCPFRLYPTRNASSTAAVSPRTNFRTTHVAPHCAQSSSQRHDELEPNHSGDDSEQRTPHIPPTDAEDAGTKRKRRQLSAESRAKISASLKGKRKSETHRENLRKRLSGEKNPMYGRKMSAETRAKISKSLTARNRGITPDMLDSENAPNDEQAGDSNRGNPDLTNGDSDEIPMIGEVENLQLWRERAQDSRLVKSIQSSENEEGKRRRKLPQDSLQDDDIEDVLERVAKLDFPPENIARLIHKTVVKSHSTDCDSINSAEANIPTQTTESNSDTQENPYPTIDPVDLDKLKFRPETRGRRKYKKKPKVPPKDPPCKVCCGTAFTTCPDCVGLTGVISSKCTTCFGAGGIFCSECNGSGREKRT